MAISDRFKTSHNTKIRQLKTISLSARCARISAIDHLSGSGRRESCHARHDPKVSLETFRVLRENNLRMLRALPEHLWENYGMHSERGKESVAQIVRLYAGHDLNHLAQIEKIAKQSGSLRKRASATSSSMRSALFRNHSFPDESESLGHLESGLLGKIPPSHRGRSCSTAGNRMGTASGAVFAGC